MKLGVDVKRIAKTLDGHLLVEMSGGPKAVSGAAALSKALRDSASGLSNRFVQLGTAMEMEIIDLDPEPKTKTSEPHWKLRWKI